MLERVPPHNLEQCSQNVAVMLGNLSRIDEKKKFELLSLTLRTNSKDTIVLIRTVGIFAFLSSLVSHDKDAHN